MNTQKPLIYQHKTQSYFSLSYQHFYFIKNIFKMDINKNQEKIKLDDNKYKTVEKE